MTKDKKNWVISKDPGRVFENKNSKFFTNENIFYYI